MNAKKGIMYAIESILAVLLLIGYVSSIFKLPLDLNDWNSATLQQENKDYINALNEIGLTSLIAENRREDFKGITSYFYGTKKGFALSTEGLIENELVIGVLTDFPPGEEEDILNMYKGNLSENIFGQEVQVTLNGRTSRLVVESQKLGGNWTKYDVLIIPNKYIASSLAMDYLTKAKNFLDEGKGIVEVADLSNEDFDSDSEKEFQTNVMGLVNVNAATSAENNAMFNDINVKSSSYLTKKYFYSIPLVINTEKNLAMNFDLKYWLDAYTVNVHLGSTAYSLGIATCPVASRPCLDRSQLDYSNVVGDYGDVFRLGNLSVRHNSYSVLVAKSYSSPIYDSIYIDANQNYWFNDEEELKIMETASVDGNYIMAKYISPRGERVEILPHKNDTTKEYKFVELGGSTKLFSNHSYTYPEALHSDYVVVEDVKKYTDGLFAGANVPVAIVNYNVYNGKTAWLSNNITSQDEWNLLKTLVLYVSNDDDELVEVSKSANNVVVSSITSIFNEDMSQPYIINFKSWYLI